MKDSNEQRIQNQFGAFCVKVLKNEARCIQREYARRREQEKPLDDLTASELEQTATWPGRRGKAVSGFWTASLRTSAASLRENHRTW